MKAPSKEIYGKSTQHNAEKYIQWVRSCRGRYGSILIRLAVVASQICEIPRNSLKIRTYTVQAHQSWYQSKTHMQLSISH